MTSTPTRGGVVARALMLTLATAMRRLMEEKTESSNVYWMSGSRVKGGKVSTGSASSLAAPEGTVEGGAAGGALAVAAPQ